MVSSCSKGCCECWFRIRASLEVMATLAGASPAMDTQWLSLSRTLSTFVVLPVVPALVYRALSPRICSTILHIKQLHSGCALVQWTYASYSAYPSGDVIVTAVFPLGRTAFRASERSESFCLKKKKVSGSILLCKSHYLHWVRNLQHTQVGTAAAKPTSESNARLLPYEFRTLQKWIHFFCPWPTCFPEYDPKKFYRFLYNKQVRTGPAQVKQKTLPVTTWLWSFCWRNIFRRTWKFCHLDSTSSIMPLGP